MWSFTRYRREKYTPSFLSRAKSTSCNQEVYRGKQYVCIYNHTHTHINTLADTPLPLHVITSLSFCCCHGNSCSFPTEGNKLKLVEESSFWCHVNTVTPMYGHPGRSIQERRRRWFRWPPPLMSRHNKPPRKQNSLRTDKLWKQHAILICFSCRFLSLSCAISLRTLHLNALCDHLCLLTLICLEHCIM